MPCRDWDENVRTIEVSSSEDKRKIDYLTRMLCEVMTNLNTLPKHFPLSKELENWWTKHQEQDRRRIAWEKSQANKEKEKRRKEWEKLNKEFGNV